MAKLLSGERIGKLGAIRFGCSAVIWDPSRIRILLTRRTDNGQWCLPAGGMDPGESVTETCEREVWEETGLRVRVLRLIGVYSDPNRLIEYADGNRCHIVSLNFEVEVTGGELQLSDETTAFGFYSPDEMKRLDIMAHHWERILDALAGQPQPFIR